MFKQNDYQYFEFAKNKIESYSIDAGSELTLEVYSRDGFRLIDILSSGTTIQTNAVGSPSNSTKYLVNNDGFVKLPVLGDIYVKGYSEKELENILSQKYATLFVDPYVILKVVNRRVFVFRGSGTGAIVDLNQSPTSLIEVLAKSGGLDKSLKAYKIKVIRGDIKNPQVQIIDLSSIEGLRKAELTLVSNDIIYIEERKRILREIFFEISPIFTVIGSVTTTILLIRNLGK